ncbi:MAG: DUF4062 domain-containing protein [Verrucomicrobiaceae bacterium]|nr:DUF4062 domain-containing protein [Verrucomicrobiaceae bacterium]
MSAAWKTVRVFISSTFKDMQAERDHLVRFVFPKLREELLKHRIHLVDVDLRWGVTSDQDATGVCRQVIDECRPRFMCILGGRYGWVPDGKDKSITADEVHYGVLDREAAKRGHAFFYFRDDKATAEMVEEVAGEYREADGSENADKLVALKQSIKDEGLPVVEYHAQWSKDQKRLVGLERFGERVHDDLLQSLKADPDLADHFTVDGSAVLDEFADEAAQMEAFIEERTERYVVGSRDKVLKQMQDFAADSGTPNIFVLTGSPGSGKSALLAKLVRQLQGRALDPSSAAVAEGGALSPLSAASDDRRVEDNAPYLIIPHFIGASTGSTDLRRTLRRLCHELAKAAGNTEPLPLDIKELITHFQKLLTEAAKEGGPLSPLSGSDQPAQGTVRTTRVILVFDALNQFDETDGSHWMNWLPRELPPGVRIIASVISPAEGEKEHQTLAILRNRKDARVEALKPLDESDTQAIIEGYLKRYSKRLSPEQIAALKAKSASNLPLYILTALEELRTLGTYEEITERIRTLPGDARALFGWILTERLARDPGFRDHEGRACGAALVEKFAACLGVSCLGVSRHGLSPTELTALLSDGGALAPASAASTDPLGNVAALLRLLRPYLMRRGELLDFYHGQFREAAEAKYLDTPEKQRAAHQSVANCLQVFADPHRDGQYRDATLHALSELPHHQTRAGAWPDLIATLENIFFLEAKVIHDMAFDLVVDFTTAVNALPIEHVERKRLWVLKEALRRDIHFIARHSRDYPQALFQCLWNSAWWYDCPEARTHYLGLLKTSWLKDAVEEPDVKLCHLLEGWRTERQTYRTNQNWVRSLRPPLVPIGNQCNLVLSGHQGGVVGVDYSVNGLLIASCCGFGTTLLSDSDWTARIWRLDDGAELLSLKHPNVVTAVHLLSNGRGVATGSTDGLRIFAFPGGDESLHLPGSNINVLAEDPDGKHLASGFTDGTIRILDIDAGVYTNEFKIHDGAICAIAYSPQRTLLACSHKGTVINWNLDTRRPLFSVVQRDALSAAFIADGNQVALITKDGYVARYDSTSGQIISSCRMVDSPCCAAFCRNSLYVATGHYDGGIRVWNYITGEETAQFTGHQDSVCSIVFSTDGQRLASGSYDETVRIWDYQPGHAKVTRTSPRHEAQVAMMQFSPNGLNVMSSTFDGDVMIWSIHDGHLLGELKGNIMSRSPNIRPLSWTGKPTVDQTRFVLSGSGLSPVWFPARLDILLTHPCGKVFAGALRRDVYLLQIEGQMAHDASRLDSASIHRLEVNAQGLASRLQLARRALDYRSFFENCEPLIEIYLALGKLEQIGAVLDECGQLMEHEHDRENAMFFYKQAEQIWRYEKADQKLTVTLLAQQRVQNLQNLGQAAKSNK